MARERKNDKLILRGRRAFVKQEVRRIKQSIIGGDRDFWISY